MIPAKNYIHRRRALAEAAKQPLIVITGTDLVQKSSDETYPFEQDGYFYYLTGIEEPGWMLVMDVQKGREFLISTNDSSYHSEVWDNLTTEDEIKDISGVKEIKNRRDGWAYLRNNCNGYQSVGSIVPRMRFSRPFGMFINPAKAMLIERLKRIHGDANLVDISVHIRNLRTIKEPEEVAIIKDCMQVTKQGFDQFLAKKDNYVNEHEIYMDFWNAFASNRADFGYPATIASGAAAAQIHYRANNRDIRPNTLLLMDVGARLHRYTADITRTYKIGQPTKRQEAVYQEVKAAQQAVFDFIGTGVSMRDSEMHIEQVIGKSLNKLGVINNMLRKSIRAHYPHAISHHLGIDVHDSCSYDLPLAPGAVITVEPGIYIPQEGIGVRIEENILITKTGYELLSEGIG